MHTESFTLTSKDGTRLYAYRQDPEGTPVADILILHGYGEHLGRYHEVMQWFAEKGYRSWAVDFRGHGRSAGRRAYVEDYDLYLEDGAALLDAVKDAGVSQTLFLLGHSQGGLIGLRMLEEGIGTYQAAVLSAPAMDVALKANPIKVAAGKALSRLWPTLNLPPEIPANQLTHDEERWRAYEEDPLVNHCVNCRWYTEFLGAQEAGFEKAGSVTTPTLVLNPTEDKVIDPESVAKLFDLLGSADKKKLVYEGFYHEPFNEPERADVFADVFGWLEEHRTA